LPLEVRQIGIRLNVGENGPEPADGREAAPGLGGRHEIDPSERAAIVEECVDAVLTAIRMQSER
jgi:hypothetical protein